MTEKLVWMCKRILKLAEIIRMRKKIDSKFMGKNRNNIWVRIWMENKKYKEN